MINKIEENVKILLKDIFKNGDTIVSYRNSGTPEIKTPLFIRNKNDIDFLTIDNFNVNNLSVYLSKFEQGEIGLAENNGRIIITTKPCDAKSIIQMISDEQIDKEKIILVVYECDGVIDLKKLSKSAGEIRQVETNEEYVNFTKLNGETGKVKLISVLLDKCLNGNCNLPYFYNYYFVGNEISFKERINKRSKPRKLIIQKLKNKEELKKMVEDEISKCIRCNACRNICPACFCSDRCVFDKPKLPVELLEKDVSLTENLLFHLIRFYHVFPNCTGCGECERVCPQGIKLNIFYKYINEIVSTEFGFIPGSTDSARQPLLSHRLGEDLV